MRSPWKPVIVVAVLALATGGCTTFVRSSAGPNGTVGNGDSRALHTVAISDSGRFTAFNSLASNLVPSDTNGAQDTFRRDNTTGRTVRVSVRDDGSQVDGASGGYAISGDGSHVAFLTDAALEPADTNGKADVYVRDVAAGTTERVSIRPDGSPIQGAPIFPSLGSASISDDGRLVVVTDFDPPLNGRAYLRNLDTDTTTVLSTTAASALLAGDGAWLVENSLCQVSPCERRAALVPTTGGAREELSEGCNVWVADVTADARFVVGTRYQSGATAAPCPAPTGLVRWDRELQLVEKIPMPNENPTPLADADWMRVSNNGRFVSVIDWTTGYPQVLDMRTGRSVIVDTDYLGVLQPALDDAFDLSISGSGRYVAFSSPIPRTPDDTNTHFDVFTRYSVTPDIQDVTPTPVPRGWSSPITVRGSGFLPGATARVSGDGVTVHDLTLLNSKRAYVEVTVDPGATPGPRDIVITNGGGFGSAFDACRGCFVVG